MITGEQGLPRAPLLSSVSDQSSSSELAFFFALHYGIFTLVHGVFAFVMAFVAGGELHPASWLLAGLALALSHPLTPRAVSSSWRRC